MSEQSQMFAVEGSGTTVLHPVGFLFLIICGVTFIFLPRKYALFPLSILICFVASRQCIAIGGLNLYFMRIMVLFFGAIRVISRSEFQSIRFNALDWCVLLYGLSIFVTGVLNFGITSPEIKMRSGFMVDIIGMYFLLRSIIRDEEDVNMAIKGLALISIPLAVFFFIEHSTGRNLFSIFGGVPELTPIREGRLRCQGAFGHPLLAGIIWAAFMPMFIYRAISKDSSNRPLFWLSIICTCCIVLLTASSTPVLGLAAAFVLMLLFPLRKLTRPAVFTGFLSIVVLHFVMQGPVWGLIMKINITAGNSGYHRFLLVDGFINHWQEWFLLGSRIGTGHWGHFTFDTANQYVSVGVQGGFVALTFFMMTIVLGFIAAGRISKHRPFLGWTVGVVLAVYCICFFGISVWGQMFFAWALPLAVISSLQQSYSRVALSERDEGVGYIYGEELAS